MTGDTTEPSYWLNWRFFLCAIWVLGNMAFASLLIYKYEDFQRSRRDDSEHQEEKPESLYEDEVWMTSLKGVHPVWLLAYRIVAFIALLSLLFADILISGVRILFFYTQWTFLLVTIYFALGFILSIYGCRKYANRVGWDASATLDEDRGTYIAPTLGEDSEAPNLPKISDAHHEHYARQPAGVWTYIFQIIFQVSAGAIALTDCVFWLILYPFLTSKDYSLGYLMATMHSINAFFLLGDTILNNLKFPLFRVSYFILWTGIFVVFQWILHACVSMWWPYPFLDLSSPYAPLWYLGVSLMHIPCYGLFALIISTKNIILSRSFPESIQ